MAIVNLRYLNVARGSVVITGNTVGLDKANNALLPGTLGSVGARLSTTNTSVAAGWSAQGALDRTVGIRVDSDNSLIGSKAVLYIPPSSRVLYAELVWFATSYTGVNANNPVTFISPLATSGVSISGAAATSNLIDMSGYSIYVRSNTVTNYVTTGNQTYEVRGIPSALQAANNNDTCIGWCLMVAYENVNESFKNMSIYVLGVPVQANASSVSVTIPNVVTPSTGPVTGRAVMASAEGDIFLTGDYVRFGPNTTTQATLVGPNNPSTNFFTSSINVGDYNPTIPTGNFDTRGSMGNNNHNLTNTLAGARQGIDITNVDISSGLTTNQTSAILTFGTTGDKYAPVALGLEIMVVPSAGKTVSPKIATLNDILTYTITINNPGTTVAWQTINLQDNIPDYTTFIPNSVMINNVSRPGLNPQTGFLVAPSLSMNASVVVTFQVQITSLPPTLPYTINNTATITYTINGATQTLVSDTASTSFVYATLSIEKTSVPSGNVSCGQVMQYTVKLINTGNTTLNIGTNQFTDPIPASTSFLPGSITPTSSGFSYHSTTNQISNQTALSIPANSSISFSFNALIHCN
ncbi:internalin, putative [Lachnospiraceae bacterium KM106-2]|nr:internalin, putative [Lachnospiraceae bacterium KM106-2]